MNRTKWIRAFAVLFSLALAFVVIGIPNHALADVSDITFDQTSPQEIFVGGTVTIGTTLTTTGTTTTNPTYTWSASPTGVVSLSSTTASSVTFTGQSAGTADLTLTVQDDGDRAASPVQPGTTKHFTIEVKPVTVSPSSATLAIGDTVGLTTTNYTNAISYSSNTPSVATVDTASGLVTAIASGSATITVTNTPANGAPTQYAYSNITVVAPTVTLNPPSQTLTSGSATTTLTLTVTNGGTVIPSGATVNWSSSEPGIGTLSSTTSTVSAGGVATINFTSSAGATNGTTTITATVGGVSRTATVTVSTVKHLDIVGPSDLNKTTRTGTYTVYLKNPDGTVYDDDTSTVHWSWSSSYLSLTSDSLNDRRADMHNGEAHIQLYAKYNTPSGGTLLYAWINSDTGSKVYHTINISGLSSLPQTGQDMTLVYVFGGLSAALLAAAGVWYGIRKKHTAA